MMCCKERHLAKTSSCELDLRRSLSFWSSTSLNGNKNRMVSQGATSTCLVMSLNWERCQCPYWHDKLQIPRVLCFCTGFVKSGASERSNGWTFLTSGELTDRPEDYRYYSQKTNTAGYGTFKRRCTQRSDGVFSVSCLIGFYPQMFFPKPGRLV